MAYTYITFAQAKTALAKRLYEASMTFFTDAELGVRIRQSLQAFNAYANFYRDTFTFNTVANTTWYDLTNVTAMPLTTRPMTMTDQDLIESIEYHFLEPLTETYPLAWTGSTQFNIADILNALQQYRDQLLFDTSCTINQELVSASMITPRTELSDTAINIRRVAWIPDTPDPNLGLLANCLTPSDIWAQQAFEPDFPQAIVNIPISYRQSTEPPLSFDVDILPAIAGNYDVLRVNAGETLSAAQSAVLPVPNDWTEVITWGAMSELLGRSYPATDSYRAQYCQMRYTQAVAAMQMAPALLAARIGGYVTSVDALSDGDFYNANWQAATPATPKAIYYAGLNLLGLSPIPDGTTVVTVSIVRNMPLPAIDADFLQIGREDVDAVLDYAQHITMFKSGGAEFAATAPLFKDFIRHCTLYNSKLAGLSPYLELLDGRAPRDQQIHPTFGTATPVETA